MALVAVWKLVALWYSTLAESHWSGGRASNIGDRVNAHEMVLYGSMTARKLLEPPFA